MTADSQRSSVSAGSSVSTTSAQRRMVRYILPANAMIGPYRIEKALGRGGMGEVYLALHTKLNVLRAIKILPARFCAADKNYHPGHDISLPVRSAPAYAPVEQPFHNI